MLSAYSLRSLSVVLSTPLKHELTRTLSEIRKAFEIARHRDKNIGSVEYAYVPRKRWRVTYLKSRFKHRKAIRHYVFEQYNYNLRVFEPRDLEALVASILGSLSPSVHARCTFSWNYRASDGAKEHRPKLNGGSSTLDNTQGCRLGFRGDSLDINLDQYKTQESIVNRIISGIRG